ncbi:MAG: hypothetical protein IT353_21115 [Gemmatimonadaceae bacterium]|nr:hypothetical protein [Gemmatimonadaceae bacterium]
MEVTAGADLSRANLPALVALWARVVADLEHRLALNTAPPSLVGEVDARHEIAERVRSKPTTAETRELLAELDQLYREMTEEVAVCIYGADVAAERGWTPQRQWYYWRALRTRR